jgi:CRISPR-associated endonuclease Csn1
MGYSLGIDLGSTSLGWSLLEMREGLPQNLIDAGVRIFHDGRDEKSKEPLAVTRRMARGMRRNRNRRILRRKKLLTLLIQNGLMPQDEKSRKKLELLNPYELRAKAAHEKISLHELGRTLFQINQRRGFKSNLKTDKGDNDLGAMKGAIRDLDAKLMETSSKTLGEYMAKRLEAGERVRICRTGIGSKASYNFYTGREMYQAEVSAILEEQAKHHP